MSSPETRKVDRHFFPSSPRVDVDGGEVLGGVASAPRSGLGSHSRSSRNIDTQKVVTSYKHEALTNCATGDSSGPRACTRLLILSVHRCAVPPFPSSKSAVLARQTRREKPGGRRTMSDEEIAEKKQLSRLPALTDSTSTVRRQDPTQRRSLPSKKAIPLVTARFFSPVCALLFAKSHSDSPGSL